MLKLMRDGGVARKDYRAGTTGGSRLLCEAELWGSGEVDDRYRHHPRRFYASMGRRDNRRYVPTKRGELGSIELRDVTVSSSGGAGYVGICITKSETCQEEIGVFRRLNIEHQGLCPVARMGHWAKRMEGRPKETKVFGDDIIWLITRLIKWSLAGRGLPLCFPIRSFRGGGATFISSWCRFGIYQEIRKVGIYHFCDFFTIRRQYIAALFLSSHALRGRGAPTKSAYW